MTAAGDVDTHHGWLTPTSLSPAAVDPATSGGVFLVPSSPMWQPLYEPPFVLPPKHAAVFRRAARGLSGLIGWAEEENKAWQEMGGIGLSVFDHLTQGQKQVAILTVAKALLDPDFEAPEVTAVLGATVDAIYFHLLSDVEMEMGYGTEIRAGILEAMDEENYWEQVNSSMPPNEEPEVRPLPDDDDADWDFYIDDLREEILDDYDHTMAKHFLDMPPGQAEALKQQLTIDPDYFVATVEDPTPGQLERVRSELDALLASADAAG